MTWWYIYIYIVINRLLMTDCFVLSELFSVARHAGRSKPGSKPVQLYVRLSFSIYIYMCVCVCVCVWFIQCFYICKWIVILVSLFLNKLELIFWFQIKFFSALIILFDIYYFLHSEERFSSSASTNSYLYTLKLFQVLICNTNNTIFAHS